VAQVGKDQSLVDLDVVSHRAGVTGSFPTAPGHGLPLR
jgi:hypothetical protein